MSYTYNIHCRRITNEEKYYLDSCRDLVKHERELKKLQNDRKQLEDRLTTVTGQLKKKQTEVNEVTIRNNRLHAAYERKLRCMEQRLEYAKDQMHRVHGVSYPITNAVQQGHAVLSHSRAPFQNNTCDIPVTSTSVTANNLSFNINGDPPRQTVVSCQTPTHVASHVLLQNHGNHTQLHLHTSGAPQHTDKSQTVQHQQNVVLYGDDVLDDISLIEASDSIDGTPRNHIHDMVHSVDITDGTDIDVQENNCSTEDTDMSSTITNSDDILQDDSSEF